MVQGPGMLSAKEQFPKEFADLGRSTLSRTVGPQGGTFDFDVPVSLDVVAGKEKAADRSHAETKKADEEKATDKKAQEKK